MSSTENTTAMKKLAIFFFVVASFCFKNLDAQWQQTNGPYGGSINCFALNGSTIFAGTTNGVFSSTDNGSTWTASNTGIANKTIRSIMVVGADIFAASTASGIYMSSDNGSTWTAVNTGLTDLKTTSLSANGTDLFVGTETGGVFYSNNSGSTWTAVNSGLTDNNITAIATSGSGTTVFAGTDSSGVFLSVNNGTSWTAVNNGLNDTSVTTLMISGSKIYAGTTTGLYTSSNNGSLWTIGGVGQYITSIAKEGSNIFAGGLYGSMYLSKNNGSTWVTANTGLSAKNILSVITSGTDVFAGTLGDGVYLSSDTADTWNQTNTGLISTEVSSLALNGTTLMGGTLNSGLFLSTNTGTNWTPSNTGLSSSAIHTIKIDGSNIFAGTDAKIFLSNDNAATWSAKNSGLISQVTFVYSMAIDGSNIYAGSNYGMNLSTNDADSWTAINSGLVYPNVVMSSIVVRGTKIFAGTGGAYGANSKGGVFLSTNNGGSWAAVNTGLTDKDVYSLAVKDTTIYAGTSSGVFVSTDNGANWAAINTGLPSTIVYALIVSGDDIIAGTGQGVYSFSGTQWTSISNGLGTNTAVTSLIYDANNLYAGTKGAGIWKRPLSEITGCSTPSCLVWPGDTDNDLIADHYDLLPIGVYFGQTGMSRDAADNLWTGHHSVDWGTLQANGKDIKYVDCNGDGIINISDTVAIKTNYGSVHTKKEGTLETQAGEPNLYIVTTYSVYSPGDDVDAEIWLGDNTTPVEKLYGAAFDFNYNESLIENGTLLSYDATLIGSSTISMKIIDEPNGDVFGAITRNNHTGASGFGKIATIKLKTKSSISTATSLLLMINDFKVIDSSGAEITVNAVNKEVTIVPPSAVNSMLSQPEIQIYPNPSRGKFVIQTGSNFAGAELKIYDLIGNEIIQQQKVGQNREVDLSDQAKGVYFVRMDDKKGAVVVTKLIVW